MGRSKAEEMTEVPERPNEDSWAIAELFEAGPDSHFIIFQPICKVSYKITFRIVNNIQVTFTGGGFFFNTSTAMKRYIILPFSHRW